MTSKELNEILNKTRRTPNISLTPEQVEELIKDLDQKGLLESELKLEKDKVKYVMKQLKKQDKILEILKVESCLLWAENGKLYSGRYGDIEIPLDEWDFNGKENQKVIKEWLEDENKNNCSFKQGRNA